MEFRLTPENLYKLNMVVKLEDHHYEVYKNNIKIDEIDLNDENFAITSIEEGIFFDCKSIKKLILPNTLKEINGLAFCGLTNLKSIVIPPSVEKIDEIAFKRNKLKEIFMTQKAIKNNKDFVNKNIDKIKEMPLDILIKGASSFKEINNFYKDTER